MPYAQDPHSIRESLVVDDVIAYGKQSHIAIDVRSTSFAELRVLGEAAKYFIESIDQLLSRRQIRFGDAGGDFNEVFDRLSRPDKSRH